MRIGFFRRIKTQSGKRATRRIHGYGVAAVADVENQRDGRLLATGEANKIAATGERKKAHQRPKISRPPKDRRHQDQKDPDNAFLPYYF